MMLAQRKNPMIIIQLLVVAMLLFGSAEAKAIETGLGEIGWDSNAAEVKQSLEGQGFEFFGQGIDAEGRQWQKFGNGQFSNFHCTIQTVWQSQRLEEINIESTGTFLLGTEYTYRNLVTRLAEQYGPPAEQDKYMLKIFPGIWVETMKWTVSVDGAPSFEIIAVQNNPAHAFGPESRHIGKIGITFKYIGDNFGQLLAAAMLEQGEEYSKNLQIVEASSVYQILLNSTDSYQFFTQTAQEYLAAYSSMEEAVEYLTEDKDFTYYGFKNISPDYSGQLWMRMELSPAVQAELQQMDKGQLKESADINAVLCRVRVIPGSGTYAVVEQIWLNDSNKIIGGSHPWQKQEASSFAPYIKQAGETFLKNWFTSGVNMGAANE